jgi:hypothetical protein
VTSHSGRSLSRGQGAIVSVAGPFAGVTLGLVVLVLDRAGALPTSGLGEDAVAAALWANLGWSVLNLMPVVPLDGGHLVAAALPGSRALRERRAAAVSVVAAVALGAVAVAYGAIFAGVVAGWFALGNVATLRQPKARPPDEIGRAVLALVDAGDPAKAWHLLSTVPGGSEVDPAIVALVVASNGNLDTGLAVARRVAAEAPADAQRAALLARIERLHEEGRTEA